MRDSIYRITLDIHNIASQVQIVAKQGDSARRIYATLTEYGQPFSVPFGSRALMGVRRPGAEDLIADCDIRSDGTIVYDFTSLTTDKPGLLECELSVYDPDNSLIASPVFTILVVKTTFEEGQTLGAEWQKAIDRAAAQIKETTDALEKKTISMPRVYPVAADLETEKFAEGQIVRTRGRWEPNDGGAREYRVVSEENARLSDGALNPLALPCAGGLYAVPILTDCVTALDIGLRRGRIRPEEVEQYDAYADEDEIIPAAVAANGGIAAENSRLLQAYIDRVPAMAMGLAEPLRHDALSGGRAKFAQIFFPNGDWAFRDPVLIRNPVTISGTYRKNEHYFSFAHPDCETSRLIFYGKELTAAAGGNGQSVYPYAPAASGYHIYEQPPGFVGDQNYDANDETKRESVYVETALFFVASNGVTLRDLEFQADGAYEFQIQSQVYTNLGWGSRPGDHTDNGGTLVIDGAADRGAAHNPFWSHRKKKGICGVICRSPETDAAGRIKVQADGKIYYKKDVRSGSRANSDISWTLVERCGFYGFSGVGLVTSRLTEIDSCQFDHNYTAIRLDGADVYIHRIYAEKGIMGINTNTHTMQMFDSYIDVMAGFAVASSFTDTSFQKRTLKTATAGGETYTYCVHENYRSSGNLLGHFDCVIDYCVMGAYACFSTGNAPVVITGRISRCGGLYSSDTRIVSQDDFGSETTYLKAKDAVEHPNRSANATWDADAAAWTGADGTPGAADTFGVWTVTNAKMLSLYGEWTAAHIQLEPQKFWFFKDGTSDEKRTRAAGCWRRNFDKMIGTAALSLGYMHTLNYSAGLFPRNMTGADYQDGGTTKNNSNITPMYAFNAINAVGGTIANAVPQSNGADGRMEMIRINGDTSSISITAPRDYYNHKSIEIETTRAIPESGWDGTVDYYGPVDEETGTQTLTLNVVLSHRHTGEPSIRVHGFLNATANVDITSDLENQTYKLYAPWYDGEEQHDVRCLPMIAATNYPAPGKTDAEHPLTVRSGDVIGSIAIRCRDGHIYTKIHPQVDYYGDIYSAIV